MEVSEVPSPPASNAEQWTRFKPWLMLAARIAGVLLLVIGFLECFYVWTELIWRYFLYDHFDQTPIMNYVTESYHQDFRGHAWTAVFCLVISGAILFWLKRHVQLGICLLLLIASVVALQVSSSFIKSGIYANGTAKDIPVLIVPKDSETPAEPEKETNPLIPASESPVPSPEPRPPVPDPSFIPEPAPPVEEPSVPDPIAPPLESLPEAIPEAIPEAPFDPAPAPAAIPLPE
jgi:hypothetical protein